jgi:DNA-binding transcriptional regulator GbsR (MarR family)
LVDTLGAGQANVSKHLRVLHNAGIVRRRPEGTSAYYSVTDPSLMSLCSIVCERLRQQVQGIEAAIASTLPAPANPAIAEKCGSSQKQEESQRITATTGSVATRLLAASRG